MHHIFVYKITKTSFFANKSMQKFVEHLLDWYVDRCDQPPMVLLSERERSCGLVTHLAYSLSKLRNLKMSKYQPNGRIGFNLAWCTTFNKTDTHLKKSIALMKARCQAQGCRAVVKMTQLRLLSSSFYEHGSGFSSGALGFHECGSGSGALFFHSVAPASVRFNTLIFSIALVCLKLNWKWIISSAQN